MRTRKSSSEYTSTSLIVQLQAGHNEAWRRLTDIYGPLVYYWCRRSELNSSDAADVVQEVFVAVARSISNFESADHGHSFRGWLATITRNKIRDFWRDRGKHPPGRGGTTYLDRMQNLPDTPAERATEGPGSSPHRSEMQAVLRAALHAIESEFEPSTWQAFWMTTAEARKPADVAADLGISVNAVYKAKSRVLHRIRQEMAGLEAEIVGPARTDETGQ